MGQTTKRMKKLIFSHDGVDYYVNGHSSHRMKVRRISTDEVRSVFEKPTREADEGYGTLIEGLSDTGRKIRIYYRHKPTGYCEILTAIKEGYGRKD